MGSGPWAQSQPDLLSFAARSRLIGAIDGAYWKMTDKLPFTLEILEFDDERPVVIDQVIGGSMYLEEAKRIGRHLLSLVDSGTRTLGYRVISKDHQLVYSWRLGNGDETHSE
jgi:hypothetical protein